jgi:hypothetical protein
LADRKEGDEVKADQVSWRPTNKLSIGAAVAPIAALNAEPAVAEVWPQIAPAILSGPAVTTAMAAICGAFAGVLAAYWVPDAPNVPREPPLVLK